ncbi:DMT family transporter [Bacillus cereus]|uniref:QacE family quaternary ammonium compound efflux SMR transporter n=1 Tax=Bacillus cereus TaxID=1396 RepID=A0A9X7BDH6_BACCE|nr:multidrug efflux SMR transporter [Bacillus cereus]PED41292.1 QacE family quaternary ammonium compound efflux SMR transporter [Bacillus cereus]PFV08648.1 QacE family quaternary ammonium compound efflux SMR transporter [Bacillus cereus]
MGWFFVVCAAICEIIGVIGLKMYSQNKTLKNGGIYLCGFGVSFAFLYTSFQYLQVSVAYAVWIGIGTTGAVLVNMFLFGEPKSKARVISVILVICGVTGLKALS